MDERLILSPEAVHLLDVTNKQYNKTYAFEQYTGGIWFMRVPHRRPTKLAEYLKFVEEQKLAGNWFQSWGHRKIPQKK